MLKSNLTFLENLNKKYLTLSKYYFYYYFYYYLLLISYYVLCNRNIFHTKCDISV
jgi:hypothetical protein